MKEQEAPEPISFENARQKRRSRSGAEPWNLDNVAKHLRTASSPIQDADYGQGQLLLIGTDKPVLALELYPAAAVARVYSQELTVDISPVAAPKLPRKLLPPDQESLLLESPSSPSLRLTLTAEGAMSLFIKGTQELHQYKLTTSSPEAQLPEPVEESTPSTTADGSASASSPEKQRRVTLEGRVGAEPVFRTTAQNKLVGRFPLAVHQGDDTIWHQVVVFGDRAKQLEAALKKGQAVEVVAYVHHNERQSRDGTKRLVEELYAVAVRQPAGQSADR